MARVVAAARASYGGLDVLVNNVGGTFERPFLEIEEKGWDALIRTNLKSVFHCTRAAAPLLIERGGGSVINVVSIEGVRAAPLYAPYAACKAGVISFTRTMALELAPQRVRVNAIAPDICLTEGLRAMLPEPALRSHAQQVPLGRAAEPAEIAGPALFLASELSSYVTGIACTSTAAPTPPAAGTRTPQEPATCSVRRRATDAERSARRRRPSGDLRPGVELRPCHLLAEAVERPRPDRRDAAVVEVPAAAAGDPDRVLRGLLALRLEARHRLLASR